MSMAEYSAIFASCPNTEDLTNPAIPIYHLVYDCPIQFQQRYPNAIMVGPAVVKDWVFHINERGETNIRPAYKVMVTPAIDYLLPGPSIKARFQSAKEPLPLYGIIFEMITAEDKTMLAKEGGGLGDRMRIGLVAKVPHPITPKLHSIKVTTFMDIHNTREGFKRIIDSAADLDIWNKNLTMMVNIGVPLVYVQSIANQLLGRTISLPQPIYVALTNLITNSMAPSPRPAPGQATSNMFQITPDSVGIEEFEFRYNTMIARVEEEETKRHLRCEMRRALEKHRLEQAGQSRKRTRGEDEEDEGVVRSSTRPRTAIFSHPAAKMDYLLSEEKKHRRVVVALRPKKVKESGPVQAESTTTRI